ncbi:MAG: hypothetical protein ACYDC0_13185 [Acidimicrobiales bacterium]
MEDNAEEVTAAGGHGIGMVCDHTNDDYVRSLFERIRNEHGYLDVLVANARGGYMPTQSTMRGSPSRSRNCRWGAGTACSPAGGAIYNVSQNAACRLGSP